MRSLPYIDCCYGLAELRVVAAFGIGFVALLAVLRLALGPSAAVPPRHFPFEQ